MPGTISPTTRPGRAPIAGARTAWPASQRRQAAALLCPGPLERQGPDPQGTPVRPDQQRGQSRRGCQGILLLPRQHADPLVHEVSSTSIRRRPIPTTTWSRPTAAAAGSELEYELLDTGIFDDDRYFDVFVEYAKAAPEDILIQISVGNRGPGGGRAPCPADALVPQHLVVVAGTGQAVAERSRRRRRAQHRSPRPTLELGDVLPVLRRRGDAAVHRERDQQRAPLRHSRTPRPTSRTASTTTSCTARRDAVNPEQTGTKAAAHYQLTVAAGQTASRPAAADAMTPRQAKRGDPFGELRRRCCARAAGRPTSSIEPLTPAGVDDDAAKVMRQALAGMLWSKQYYYFDVNNGSRSMARSR